MFLIIAAAVWTHPGVMQCGWDFGIDFKMKEMMIGKPQELKVIFIFKFSEKE